MKSLRYYIDQMNHLLDQLIETAQTLKDVSKQVISEEELAPLQEKQQTLLTQLEEVDCHLHEHFREQLDQAIHQHFHERLQIFQALNQEFIQNLNASHGLIQFELRHLKGETQASEREEIPFLTRSNKVSSTPQSSQAIKAQKSKKK